MSSELSVGSNSSRKPLDFESFYSRRASIAQASWFKPAPYDFGGANPDPRLFPTEQIKEAASTVLSRYGGEFMTYPPQQGHLALREIISKKIEATDRVTIPPEQIAITNGSMQGLCMVADTFVNSGELVFTEQFTYPGTLRAFRRTEPIIRGVRLDGEGISIEDLRAKLNTAAPKFTYVIPNFQNPTGSVLNLSRRMELLTICEERGIPLIEDDAYGDLIFEGEPEPSLYSLSGRDGVVRLGSFSKVVSAGMRLGWIIAPDGVLRKLMATKVDLGVNSFATRVVAHFLSEHMDERLRFVKEAYRRKRDAMLRVLEENLSEEATWTRPRGGVFIWLRLPDETDPKRLLQTASERGVTYFPGPYFSPEGEGGEYIRLSYAYNDEEEIAEGVKRLVEAISLAKRAG